MARYLRTFANIYRSPAGRYRFTIVTRDGKIIAVSQFYTRKSSAIRGVSRIYSRAIIPASVR